MRFELDCVAGRDGRLEGTLAWEHGDPVPFSGTLELLRLLEDRTPRQAAAPAGERSRSGPRAVIPRIFRRNIRYRRRGG